MKNSIEKCFSWVVNKWLVVVTILTLMSFSVFAVDTKFKNVELKGSDKSISKTYFGMHIHRADTTTDWPAVKFGSWRLVNSFTNWFELQPEKNRWSFGKLDRYVDMAEKNNVDILMTLMMTPKWASARPTESSAYGYGYAAEPANMEDWRNYVRTVGHRYKGRIFYYEIWNEPNLSVFYTGTIPQMVEMTRIASEELKKIDTNIKIVSPGVGDLGNKMQWLDDFFYYGGGQYIDIVGGHYYSVGSNPESILYLIQDTQRILKKYDLIKPIWNTESSWAIANEDGSPSEPSPSWKKLDRSNAGAYIARSHILMWAAGVERYYWHAWDNGYSGFVNPTTFILKKHVVDAYKKTIEWLQGSVIKSCNKSAMVWSCAITEKNGNNAWLVWTEEEKTVSWAIPKDWQVTEAESLDGSKHAVEMNHQATLLINQSPVLLHAGLLVR